MKMIERVAYKIFETEWQNANDADRYLKMAKAAIEAMRKPTSDMTRAGYESTPHYMPIEPGDAWEAMINEALTEKPE